MTLLPHPRVFRPQPGQFPLTVATPVTGDAELAAVVRAVLARLPWPQPQSPQPQSAQPQSAQPQSAQPQTTHGIHLDRDAALHPEGYRLQIGPQHIRIAACAPAGAFYAAQTIRQLLPADAWRAATHAVTQALTPATAQNQDWAIECAEIEDEPATAWRGAMLDVSRHFFAKPVVLRFIDMLAAHKLNRLHLHLTDDQGWRIESRRYPSLHQVGSHRPSTQIAKDWDRQDGVPHGGYYTLSDLAEIHAYASQRMVTIVPELEVPGHARALLAALPELAAAPGTRELTVATTWGIHSQIMAPLPDTLATLETLFDELLDAVPAPYVHIGGDECVLTDWESDPRIAAYQKEKGLASPEALHAYFLRQVADLLAAKHNARSIVWDEGYTSTSTSTGAGTGLRPDTIVMAWHGLQVAEQAARDGYDVIGAPQAPLYFDNAQAPGPTEPVGIGGVVTLEDVTKYAPVPQGWPETAVHHLLGAQFQLWTEYIADPRALDYLTFPRAAAFAEVVWSGAPAQWQEFEPRLEDHLARLTAAGIEYRPRTGPHPWQQRPS